MSVKGGGQLKGTHDLGKLQRCRETEGGQGSYQLQWAAVALTRYLPDDERREACIGKEEERPDPARLLWIRS